MSGGAQLSLLAEDEAAGRPEGNHGEVFTRRWVAELILDVAGYVTDAPLGTKLIVEPSCGTGGFLVPIVERLLASVGIGGIEACQDRIIAFDLLPENAEVARKEVEKVLTDAGVPLGVAAKLGSAWVHTGDFLLDGVAVTGADFVVGNPPYVRLEDVDAHTMKRYREVCSTMRGRSDLYVGFFERGLEALNPGGTLAYICADRWMHNQYGAALRELITRDYAVELVLKMHEVDAFEVEVSAYPAITVLRRTEQKAVVVADASRAFGPSSAATLTRWLAGSTSATRSTGDFSATRVRTWANGRDHWPSGSPKALALIADLERAFPALHDEETGTRVGIGLATGADDVFITRDAELVEAERLLPLLRAADIATGEITWSGDLLVNPWHDDGLVDLAAYPRLAAYLEEHNDRVRARHVARRMPETWYRTIDRVMPNLRTEPKLLLPDIKASSHPVLDPGHYYPHHNLYFVTSRRWDLEVLGGLLLSDFTNLFIGTYCVKMRGGCYRFQAQYLRKIRVPPIADIDPGAAAELAAAFRLRDRERATEVAASLYGVDLRVLTGAL
jgi:hypothetical protein